MVVLVVVVAVVVVLVVMMTTMTVSTIYVLIYDCSIENEIGIRQCHAFPNVPTLPSHHHCKLYNQYEGNRLNP